MGIAMGRDGFSCAWGLGIHPDGLSEICPSPTPKLWGSTHKPRGGWGEVLQPA